MAKSKKPVTRLLIMNELDYPIAVHVTYDASLRQFQITVSENDIKDQNLPGTEKIMPGFNLTVNKEPTDSYLVKNKLGQYFELVYQTRTILQGPDKGLRALCLIMKGASN